MNYNKMRSWRWWLRWTWRGALILMVLLILSHLGMSLLAKRRLQVAHDALLRSGAPMEQSDVIPQVPAAENAAPYDQAAALLLYAGVPLPRGVNDLDLPPAFAELLAREEGKAGWTDATVRQHAIEILTSGRYEQVHALLVEGARLPRCAFLVDWSLCYRVRLDEIPELVALVKLECVRAELLFRQGDDERAGEDLRIAGMLTQHLSQCPTFFSLSIACNRWTTVVRTLHRMVDLGHLPPSLIEAARAAIALPDLWRQAVRDADFERVMFGEPAFAELYPWIQYPLAAFDRATYETIMLAERQALVHNQSPEIGPLVRAAPSSYLMTKTGISACDPMGEMIEHTQRWMAIAQAALELEAMVDAGALPSDLDAILSKDATLARHLGRVRYLGTSTGWQLDVIDPPYNSQYDWHWQGHVPEPAPTTR